jgi:thymidylate kinase
MENIFNKIGFAVSLKKENQNDVAVTLLSINNPDGTPRWIWNAKCNKPLFLKFYNVGSKRAFLFASIIKLVFLLKLQKIAFKKKTYFISKLGNELFDFNNDWAIFTGTVGPNNKAILYANNSFYKIATTANAQTLINDEHKMLEKINSIATTFITPKTTKISNEVIQLSDISNNGKRLKKINSSHLNSLIEMNKIENKTIKVSDWELFTNLKNEFKTINDKRIPKNTIRKINAILNTIPTDELVELSLSQGDFTQWNMFEKDGKLSIYDWELASSDKPKAFDYFHFIIQNDVLVDHKSWKEIYSDIINFSKDEFSDEIFNYDLDELNNYLKWYLLINCMHYLKVYADQPKWHVQVEWLLQVWTEALNIFLLEENTSRELVIMDLFDAIQNQEYAALKFQNGFPEKLSLNSDIDLVIDKKMNDTIIQVLKRHSLVSKITTCKRSFMNTIQVFTNDANILSVDLIWQLKRRNLEILNAEKVIANNFINTYGVKNASNIDTARYVVLFYILNGAKIPAKYLVYEEAISNSNEAIDLNIAGYFNDNSKDKFLLQYFINQYKSNKGLNHIKNTFNYIIDTLKNSKKSNGFIVTFSGVDGAGKSTVIENIAYRIEKQFRKKVVVLRHRPSVLPILSVWSKGKEKAHQDTISSLPRQGKNSSFLSSLLRFTYYYCDYLFGQFVIYFKHILRGHVVIYDRYYFDFINDSKRSNIVLPKNISRFGYNLLLKPKYNFFLFADANIILNRKKELSKETIESLTKDYTQLFNSLQSNSNSSVYMPINNIDLETTLNQIIKTVNLA